MATAAREKERASEKSEEYWGRGLGQWVQAKGTIFSRVIREDFSRKVIFEECPEENGVSNLVTK